MGRLELQFPGFLLETQGLPRHITRQTHCRAGQPNPNLNTSPRCPLNDARWPRFFYILLVFLGLLMAAYYYPRMPERMASHFAGDGRPNASQPNARINLPNRDYWLASERRAQTMNYISAFMGWFGCAVLFVLISGTFLAFQA